MALWERNESINQVTVAHELDRRGRLEEVGGLTYLSELVLNLPTPIGVENYAQIVKRDATYRQMLSVATNIAQIAYQGGPDLEAALSKAESLIYALRSGDKLRDFVHIRDFLDPYLDPPDAETSVPYGGHVRTGLSQLDQLLGGLNPSDLVIVAARTGVGKTSLMLNFARNAAVGQGAKVAVFSLEMAGEQLAQRLLAAGIARRLGAAAARPAQRGRGEPHHARARHPQRRGHLHRRQRGAAGAGAARQGDAPAARPRPRPHRASTTCS